LSGIVGEYKGYKETNVTLSNSLQDKEKEIGQSNLSLKDKDSDIKRLGITISTLEKDIGNKLVNIKENHAAEIELLKQRHVEEIERVKDKTESRG
jgi:gas vesicle protein